MNDQKFGPAPVLGLALGAGILGFILRKIMLPAYDGAAYVLLWILTLAALGGLGWLAFHIGTRSSAEENFPASKEAGIALLAAAVLIFARSLSGFLAGGDWLGLLTDLLGMLSAFGLGIQAIQRFSGKCYSQIYLVVTAYAAFYLITNFRVWCISPLLGSYCFLLLACVASMLAVFYLSGFSLGQGQRRQSVFCSMAAVFLCMVSLADGGYLQMHYFLAMLLVNLFGGCSLQLPKRPRRVLGGGTVEPEAETRTEDAQ